MNNRNLKVIISYRGTNYRGFQKQANGVTIQQIVEDNCTRIFNHKAWIHGCSRTDRGVHANGYCFSVETESVIPCEKFILAMNTLLPDDIAVISCEDVSSDFHARHMAISKEYIYKIYLSKQKDPFLTDTAVRYPYSFDIEKVRNACKCFIGTHDFEGFCNYYKNSNENILRKPTDTVRHIFDFNVTENGNLKIFLVKGNGFLYNMVRVLVGTVLSVNEDKILLENLPDIIISKDRALAGRTMPPQGLYLNRVFY